MAGRWFCPFYAIRYLGFFNRFSCPVIFHHGQATNPESGVRPYHETHAHIHHNAPCLFIAPRRTRSRCKALAGDDAHSFGKNPDRGRHHLIVPVTNVAKGPGASILLGIYDGDKRVQDFTVGLPQGDDPYWLAAYPIEPFALKGKQIEIAPVEANKMPESCRAALGKIRIGAAGDALAEDDYAQPYRNQFHAGTRRGWVNDPNGIVFHGGKYHLYYQHNPLVLLWGNMHWGHLQSADLVHREEKPIALYQRTTRDMAFSGGGITFTELPENPVVRHSGRDPKIIWHQPERKWIMVVFNDKPCAETEATPPQPDSPK
jgi:hypothetical protein